MENLKHTYTSLKPFNPIRVKGFETHVPKISAGVDGEIGPQLVPAEIFVFISSNSTKMLFDSV